MSGDRRRELLALYVAWITVFGAAFAGGGVAFGLLVDGESIGTSDSPNVLAAVDDIGAISDVGNEPGNVGDGVGSAGNDTDTLPASDDDATDSDPAPVSGCPVVIDEPSTDPDGDGRCEDVDGDGDIDGDDVNTLSEHLDDDVIQENAAAFDFSGDGTVNVVDIADLSADLSAEIETEASGCPTVTGLPAGDPDGDDRCEDVDGDGDLDSDDVGALRTNLGEDAVQENVAAFDFNGDGMVNIIDAGTLAFEVDEEGDDA